MRSGVPTLQESRSASGAARTSCCVTATMRQAWQSVST